MMLRKALRNGLILALLSMLAFFKAIEFADAITGRHTVEQPIQYPTPQPTAAARCTCSFSQPARSGAASSPQKLRTCPQQAGNPDSCGFPSGRWAA